MSREETTVTRDDHEEKGQVHKTSSENQNFGLSKIQFDNIVDKLKFGDEGLFEKIFLSHFEDCIIYLQKNFKASRDQAYDITMDTLIAFRLKLLTDKIVYGNLRFLFTKMASQLYLKSISSEDRMKNIFQDDEETDEDMAERIFALKNAWQTMTIEDRKLLESVYYLDIPLNKIAESTNKSDAALRKQKQRAIDKLRQIFFTVYNNQQ
jgi:DNA-directed RNA polymerase specialized sigma24 family protein